MNSKSIIAYNKKLLPYKPFKIITQIDEIMGYYLVRLPGKTVWWVKKEENFSKLIDPIEFGRGLSMNLLSVYQHKDARIRPRGKVRDSHHQPWNEGDDNILPQVLSYRKKANFFGIRIENVGNLSIGNVDVVFKSDFTIPDPNFSAYVKVVHCPTKCNYWHFELKTYLRNSNGLDFELASSTYISNRQKERMMKVIGQVFQDKIEEYLEHSSSCFSKYLPKRIYRKS